MESKSARRRNRQNNVACEEESSAQQAFDKIWRLEGRFGTLHEKFKTSIDEAQEFRSQIDMLEKLLLFIDVDKLNEGIKMLSEKDCLVKAYFLMLKYVLNLLYYVDGSNILLEDWLLAEVRSGHCVLCYGPQRLS